MKVSWVSNTQLLMSTQQKLVFSSKKRLIKPRLFDTRHHRDLALVLAGVLRVFSFSCGVGLLAAPGCGAALPSCRVPIPFLIPVGEEPAVPCRDPGPISSPMRLRFPIGSVAILPGPSEVLVVRGVRFCAFLWSIGEGQKARRLRRRV